MPAHTTDRSPVFCQRTVLIQGLGQGGRVQYPYSTRPSIARESPQGSVEYYDCILKLFEVDEGNSLSSPQPQLCWRISVQHLIKGSDCVPRSRSDADKGDSFIKPGIGKGGFRFQCLIKGRHASSKRERWKRATAFS